MKKNIEWHKRCLGNQEDFLKSSKDRLEKEQARHDESVRSARLYKDQIELAEKEKKDGFDREKYAIKRLCI